ncbi:unnamed protein product, partial [Cuscuta epithymum]
MRDAFRIIKSFPSLPRLVVVDLDYTLWPFYCHSRSEHDYAELYPQAREILLALHEMGIGVAIASRTPTPNIARAFLLKLGLGSIFIAKEMFPSRSPKTEHFERIHRRTMVPYNQMLFFDDEKRNIDAVHLDASDDIILTLCYIFFVDEHFSTYFSIRSASIPSPTKLEYELP